MRISDWSSDVCSSDLPAASECQTSTVAPAMGTPSALRTLPVTYIGEPSIAVPMSAPRSKVGGGTRSEEHTSELQSLMRISYAVFCLKQKTKNMNNKQY